MSRVGGMPFEMEREEDREEENPLLTENNELIDLEIPDTLS